MRSENEVISAVRDKGPVLTASTDVIIVTAKLTAKAIEYGIIPISKLRLPPADTRHPSPATTDANAEKV
jgi:hypothetical protein